MNIVASVTTIADRPTKAIRKPLIAPIAAPTASASASAAPMNSAPESTATSEENSEPLPRNWMIMTLTSEITAPADRSKPPARMTMVSPTAASARVAAPVVMELTSK